MAGVSAAAGVLALIVAGLLMWKKALPKIAAVMLLVAGAGIGGAVGGWLRRAANTVEGFVNTLTDAAVGAAAGGLIVIVLAFIVFHDLWPKHKANRVTHAAAFALPIFGFAGGGIVASALGAAVSAVASALMSFATYL